MFLPALIPNKTGCIGLLDTPCFTFSKVPALSGIIIELFVRNQDNDY